jgi:GrpB-like predicted nucleotidyltransferase (UPF0157 family)
MLISTYNPQWPLDYEKIKNRISEAMINIPFKIEHVGSTSIPFCDAKPIIDIDIIFNEIDTFTEIKRRLESIGYYHNGDQGIEGREVFKRGKKLFIEDLDTITHHLYVCRADNKELARHLLFRDYLRRNDHARDFYVKLKKEIALEANQDKSAYAELKQLKANSFIDYVIELESMKAYKE